MTDDRFHIHVGSCLDVLPTLPDCSVDSVVTDPPYELGFMGKAWDKSGIAYNVQVWRECLRVLKPGGHLLAFGGSRTYHRLACAVEDAGFDIRDQIMWLYGSGFPKSLDVSKAIDKAAGSNGTRGPMKRGGERLARLEDGKRDGEGRWGNESGRDPFTYVPATDLARQWHGWGTALKPAHEPIVVARKPLDGTVAENVTRWGTGAINVDGCRVGIDPNDKWARGVTFRNSSQWTPGSPADRGDIEAAANPLGRWPANIIHDGSEEVVEGMGDASRYYYCAKASKADRDDGCGGMPKQKPHPPGNEWGTTACFNGESGDDAWKAKNPNLPRANHHPTVKPTTLMRYLCRLVTPPGGLVLDPFTGSGSTGRGAVAEGFRFIGIELSDEYVEIARRRIAAIEPALLPVAV